jgi:hypothetical protein
VRLWLELGNDNKQVARVPRHMHKLLLFKGAFVDLLECGGGGE